MKVAAGQIKTITQQTKKAVLFISLSLSLNDAIKKGTRAVLYLTYLATADWVTNEVDLSVPFEVQKSLKLNFFDLKSSVTYPICLGHALHRCRIGHLPYVLAP